MARGRLLLGCCCGDVQSFSGLRLHFVGLSGVLLLAMKTSVLEARAGLPVCVMLHIAGPPCLSANVGRNKLALALSQH